MVELDVYFLRQMYFIIGGEFSNKYTFSLDYLFPFKIELCSSDCLILGIAIKNYGNNPYNV